MAVVRFVDSRVNFFLSRPEVSAWWLLLHPPVITELTGVFWHHGLRVDRDRSRIVVQAVLSETQLHPFPLLFPLLIRCMVVVTCLRRNGLETYYQLRFCARRLASKVSPPFYFRWCTENRFNSASGTYCNRSLCTYLTWRVPIQGLKPRRSCM